MFTLFAASALLLTAASRSTAFEARADWVSQSSLAKEFDVTKHLGNLSPYSEAPSHLSKDLPDGCKVDQVSLMQRHGSRFPLASELVYTQNVSYLFGNNTMLLKNVPSQFEFLKSGKTPPGRQQLFDHGVAFNLSYPHLSTSLLLAGAQDRVIESAQWFRMGYFGIDFASRSTLETIPEDSVTFSRITPMNNCSNWKYDYGLTAVNAWNAVYLPPIANRLDKVLPGFNFTLDNVHGMLYACAYELAAYGSTPWCAVFEQTEILDFEYELDLLMEYAFGYGLPGKLGPTLGSVYVNTLVDRLTNSTGNSTQMYLDFGHDTTIDLALTALGLAKDTPTISATGPVNPSRAWRTTTQVPFAAQMVTERLSCSNQTYVRILLNNAPLPLTFCRHMHPSTGACTLDDFVASNAASANVTQAVFNQVCNNTASS